MAQVSLTARMTLVSAPYVPVLFVELLLVVLRTWLLLFISLFLGLGLQHKERMLARIAARSPPSSPLAAKVSSTPTS